MTKAIKNSDVLFYVQNNVEAFASNYFDQSKNKIKVDPNIAGIKPSEKGSKKMKEIKFENQIPQIDSLVPVEKDVFQAQILNVTNFFNDLIPPISNEGDELNLDKSSYVLDQIEVNLAVEFSGGLKFLLAAKGNAGIKIIFKRR